VTDDNHRIVDPCFDDTCIGRPTLWYPHVGDVFDQIGLLPRTTPGPAINLDWLNYQSFM
jgi:hypothetical protein